MNIAHAVADPNHLGRAAHGSSAPGHGEGGPASKRIIIGYGFWIFLLSDIIMFSAFFAAYAVLHGATAGGQTSQQLFDLNNVAIETGCLLASSFMCGMAGIAVGQRSQRWTQVTLLITGLLGLTFLLLEIREFAGLVARGAGPTHSAFLSAFFTLVGCHGLHVTLGTIMLIVILGRSLKGHFSEHNHFAFEAVAWYWHFVDVVWLLLFVLVYWV